MKKPTARKTLTIGALILSLVVAVYILLPDGSFLRRRQGVTSDHRVREDLTNELSKPQIGEAPAPAKPPKFLPKLPKYQTAAFDSFASNSVGKNARLPDSLYRAEKRSLVWAGAMETTIGRRFDSLIRDRMKLPGLKADTIDCRTSSCRLEVSWDQADAIQAFERSAGTGENLDPLSLVNMEFGPLASIEYREPVPTGAVKVPLGWDTYRSEDGRFRTSVVLLMGPGEIDPGDYSSFLQQVAANRQRRIDRQARK